jgi:hypothetical protein
MSKTRHTCIVVLAGLLAGLSGCSDQSTHEPDIAAAIPKLQQRLTDLNNELIRIEDTRAIKNLQRAYGYYVAMARWDQVADLFTGDATMELAGSGVFAGRERIRQLLYRFGNGKPGLEYGQLNEHIQIQPVINIAANGDSAQGRWRALIMTGQYGAHAYIGEGTYENAYRKEGGIWKISKLHWYQTFIVPYEGGWGANEDVTGGLAVSPDLTPDHPATENYPVWPGVNVPPFHYDNPVSGRK